MKIYTMINKLDVSYNNLSIKLEELRNNYLYNNSLDKENYLNKVNETIKTNGILEKLHRATNIDMFLITTFYIFINRMFSPKSRNAADIQKFKKKLTTVLLQFPSFCDSFSVIPVVTRISSIFILSFFSNRCELFSLHVSHWWQSCIQVSQILKMGYSSDLNGVFLESL